MNENDCLNNNNVNTSSVEEFPNDDHLLSEIDLHNLSEVSELIERYESAITKQQSDNKTVNITVACRKMFYVSKCFNWKCHNKHIWWQ